MEESRLFGRGEGKQRYLALILPLAPPLEMKSVLNMESVRSWKGDVEAISHTHKPIGRDGREVRKGRKQEGRRYGRQEERKVEEERQKGEKRR